MAAKGSSIVVLVLVLTSLFTLPVHAGTPNQVSIDRVAFSDGTTITQYHNATLMWSPSKLNVTLSARQPGAYQVCLRSSPVGEKRTRTLSCAHHLFKDPGTASVPLAVDKHLNGTDGGRVLRVSVTDASGHELANWTRRVRVLARSGDFDGDGLSNGREVKLGTNVTSTDTDHDGLVDGAEVHTYHTSPRRADTDGDGLRDPTEINLDTNPNKSDTDGDGLPDGLEHKLGTDPKNKYGDADGNGILDSREVALGLNPTKADTDGDGIPDAVELELGTSPTNPWWSTWWFAGGAVGVILLAALLRRSAIAAALRTPIDALLGRETAAETADETADPPADVGDGNDADGTAGEPEIPAMAPPLSDEDRVREIIDEHGGRLRQGVLVEETDWSKSKVSRVLSRMADDDQITKIRVGRENVVMSSDALSDGSSSREDPSGREAMSDR
ncbi:MAG: hypothetical protein ABEJ28_07460 [Salinigranum sp.]